MRSKKEKAPDAVREKCKQDLVKVREELEELRKEKWLIARSAKQQIAEINANVQHQTARIDSEIQSRESYISEWEQLLSEVK